MQGGNKCERSIVSSLVNPSFSESLSTMVNILTTEHLRNHILSSNDLDVNSLELFERNFSSTSISCRKSCCVHHDGLPEDMASLSEIKESVGDDVGDGSLWSVGVTCLHCSSVHYVCCICNKHYGRRQELLRL